MKSLIISYLSLLDHSTSLTNPLNFLHKLFQCQTFLGWGSSGHYRACIHLQFVLLFSCNCLVPKMNRWLVSACCHHCGGTFLWRITPQSTCKSTLCVKHLINVKNNRNNDYQISWQKEFNNYTWDSKRKDQIKTHFILQNIIIDSHPLPSPTNTLSLSSLFLSRFQRHGSTIVEKSPAVYSPSTCFLVFLFLHPF